MRASSLLTVSLAFAACAVPGDREFCDHVVRMQMNAEGVSGTPSADDLSDCIGHLPKVRARMGDEWDSFARCAMKAVSSSDFERCSPRVREMFEEDRNAAEDSRRAAEAARRQVEVEHAAAVAEASAEASAAKERASEETSAAHGSHVGTAAGQ